VWSTVEGSIHTAGIRPLFNAALAIDSFAEAPAANLSLLNAYCSSDQSPRSRIATVTSQTSQLRSIDSDRGACLAGALARAGYETMHFIVKLGDPAKINLGIPHHVLDFASSRHTPIQIQQALRECINHFDPDCVILSGRPSMLSLLAAAVRNRPYFLGPDIVNLHDLPDEGTEFTDDSAQPDDVHWGLFRTSVQRDELRQTLWNAEGVLVPAPESQSRFAPYCRSVRVVPWGGDITVASNDSSTPGCDKPNADGGERVKLCLVNTDSDNESSSGLHAILRQLSTIVPAPSIGFLGGNDSESFAPNTAGINVNETSLRMADCIVFLDGVPHATLAALMVEAMGCGRPVVVPRNGITTYLMSDGVEGVMFEPRHPADVIRAVRRLVADAPLRQKMGAAGRRTVVKRFSWDVIIERGYRPILEQIAWRSGQPLGSSSVWQ
jgi:hypothetical protein